MVEVQIAANELVYAGSGGYSTYKFTEGAVNSSTVNKMSAGDLTQLRSIIGPLLEDIENAMQARGFFVRYTNNSGGNT